MQTHKHRLYFPYTLNKHIRTHISTHTVIKERISVCTSHEFAFTCIGLHRVLPYRLHIYCSCFILQLIAAVCELLRDSHVYLGVGWFLSVFRQILKRLSLFIFESALELFSLLRTNQTWPCQTLCRIFPLSEHLVNSFTPRHTPIKHQLL